MTIFKYSKDGKLYAIQVKEVDGVNKHTAIPIGHEGKSIQDCDVKEFSIQDNKNGKRNFGFL